MPDKPEQEFSKTGRKLSMTAKAIASRGERKKAHEKANEKPEEKEGEESTAGETSTGSIGVDTPDKDEDTYFCSNCRGAVTMSQNECPVCGESLRWSDL